MIRQRKGVVAVGGLLALGTLIGLIGLIGLLGCDRGIEHPGRKPFEYSCGICHRIGNILAKRKDPEGWRRTVTAMRQRGARLNDEEAESVIRYLATIRPLK